MNKVKNMEAIPEILVREAKEYGDENYIKFLNKSSERLEQMVNYGTHILDEGFKKAKGDTDVPLNLLFQKLLGELDAIDELIKHSVLEPCSILLRVLFEDMLYIFYLTEKDYERRSLSYLYYYYCAKLKEYERYIIGTQRNIEFTKKFSNDRRIKKNFLTNPIEIERLAKNKIKNLNSLLEKEIFVEIKQEYLRLKKEKKRFSWYTLFTGCRRIEDLASYLKFEIMYEIIYRDWSQSVHSTDLITGKLGLNKEGKSSVYQIRFSFNSKSIVLNTINIARESFTEYSNFISRDTGFRFKTWYRKEMKPFIEELVKLNVKYDL